MLHNRTVTLTTAEINSVNSVEWSVGPYMVRLNINRLLPDTVRDVTATCRHLQTNKLVDVLFPRKSLSNTYTFFYGSDQIELTVIEIVD